MKMSALSIKMKQAFGKLWRSYIVDECPEEDWELFEGREIPSNINSALVVSTQARFPSYHHEGHALRPS
jgi:hypothetical protein